MTHLSPTASWINLSVHQRRWCSSYNTVYEKPACSSSVRLASISRSWRSPFWNVTFMFIFSLQYRLIDRDLSCTRCPRAGLRMINDAVYRGFWTVRPRTEKTVNVHWLTWDGSATPPIRLCLYELLQIIPRSICCLQFCAHKSTPQTIVDDVRVKARSQRDALWGEKNLSLPPLGGDPYLRGLAK